MGKRKHKEISSNLGKTTVQEENNDVVLEPVISSDEPPVKQVYVIYCNKVIIRFIYVIAKSNDTTIV